MDDHGADSARCCTGFLETPHHHALLCLDGFDRLTLCFWPLLTIFYEEWGAAFTGPVISSPIPARYTHALATGLLCAPRLPGPACSRSLRWRIINDAGSPICICGSLAARNSTCKIGRKARNWDTANSAPL